MVLVVKNFYGLSLSFLKKKIVISIYKIKLYIFLLSVLEYSKYVKVELLLKYFKSKYVLFSKK